MAYDKIVDSALLDADIKQVADAIREKGGTSDALAFPSGMAQAIAAIQASEGGASPTQFDLCTGTFIVSEATNRVPVFCNFEVKSTDKFAVFYVGFPIAERTTDCNISAYCAHNMPSAALPSGKYCLYGYASGTATKISTSTSDSYVISAPSATEPSKFNLRGYGAWNFNPSYEYIWGVVKEKTV